MARIIRRVGGPLNPLLQNKAGAKDPRDFHSGNRAGEVPDIQQFADMRAGLARLPASSYAALHKTGAEAQQDAVVRTIPTRVNYVIWNVLGSADKSPVLLVPRNPARLGLIIPNFHGDGILFSFGFPPQDTTGAFLGIPVAPDDAYQEGALTVGINDIYVWETVVGAGQLLAYEAINAPEGNE